MPNISDGTHVFVSLFAVSKSSLQSLLQRWAICVYVHNITAVPLVTAVCLYEGSLAAFSTSEVKSSPSPLGYNGVDKSMSSEGFLNPHRSM